MLKSLLFIGIGSILTIVAHEAKSREFNWIVIHNVQGNVAVGFMADEYVAKTKYLPKNVVILGEAKFLPSRDSSSSVELGYRTKTKIEGTSEWESEEPKPGTLDPAKHCSSVEMEMELRLLDQDGFVLATLNTEKHMLSWDKESNFQGIGQSPISRDISARVRSIEGQLRLLSCDF